jgi:hypothetical protein
MPQNALTMARSSSPISRAAWCAVQPNCIRRITPELLPEIAFSVETSVRRQGVGSILFKKLIAEARIKGYQTLRITTGAQNQAMRALARKFGADLTFRHGESSGTIDLRPQPQAELAKPGIATPLDAARAIVAFNRAYWKLLMRIYGWGRTA